MPDPDFSAFELLPKGHLYQDFTDGQNQRGETVVRCRRTNLIAKRSDRR